MQSGKFYSKNRGKGKLEVVAENGTVVKTMELDVVPGFNFYEFSLQVKPRASKDPKKVKDPKTLQEALADPYSRPVYMAPGKYKIRVTVNNFMQVVDWEIDD